MRKKLLILLTLIVSVAFCLGLGACGDTPPDEQETIQLNGVTFESETVVYDGIEKELLITGELPQGVSVIYENNKGTTAGIYKAKAIFSKEGFKSKTLNATLTIEKATYDMSQAKWDYVAPFVYDGTEKSVQVIDLPTGVSVASYLNGSATNASDYVASAIFDYDNLNYNEPSIENCSWTIEKANFVGIVLDGPISVEYDTLEHSLQVMGDVPSGANVKITYNGESVSGVSEVGVYKVVAIITSPNHNTLTL